MGEPVIREWLPQLLTGLVATCVTVAGGVFITMDESRQVELAEQWATAGENETVNLRLPVIVWATIAFSAISGFYIAAAMAGFVHRSEPWE